MKRNNNTPPKPDNNIKIIEIRPDSKLLTSNQQSRKYKIKNTIQQISPTTNSKVKLILYPFNNMKTNIEKIQDKRNKK